MISGYKHSFEIYIQKDKPADIRWERFINAVFDYDNDFILEINFEKSEVEFHLHTKRDLSNLTTRIQPFIFKPEHRENWVPEGASMTIALMTLPLDKSILDIKEREELKKGRALKKVLWHFKSHLKKIHQNWISLYFEKASGRPIVINLTLPSIPFYLLDRIDWTQSVKYKKKEIPIYLKIENVTRLFTHEQKEGFLEVDGFPYLATQNYLPLKAYEFDKHTMVIGQTGVGKSKFLGLFVKELVKRRLQEEYAVVVIDPHASLYADLNQIQPSVNIDFMKSACDLFSKRSNPKIATELTIMLFKMLLESQFNAKMEQVLKYTLYVLFSANEMSLFNIKKFLTEYEYRTEVFKKPNIEDNMIHFFDAEFPEIQTKFYETAVMPVLTLIDELNFLPVFGSQSSDALVDILNKNFLTTFSLSRIFLGERATRLIAGLLIQQVFLISQNRQVNKKIILIVDEASVVQSDALVTILAEARKFNLSLFLSVQYLNQLKPELLKGILSNTFNYFIFRAPEEDAKILTKNFDIDIPEEVVKQWEEKRESKEELKIKAITLLNTRYCLVRCYANGKFYDVFKARTPDMGAI